MERGRMKHEEQLRIQAWMDGELPPKEAAQIATLIEQDAEAMALVEELRMVENSLHLGEKQAVLDETRDFYWSQIERHIDAEEPMTEEEEVPELVGGSQGQLLRWLIPVGGLGAVFALMVNLGTITPDPTSAPAPMVPSTAPNSGLTEKTGGMEEENPEPGEIGGFNFQGSQGSGVPLTPEDPNRLPESIENPDR